MKIRQFKKTMDVIMILLVFIIAFSGCMPNTTEDEKNYESHGATVQYHYRPSNKRSFVKLKINRFYDKIYSQGNKSYNIDHKFLLAECTVIKDYYKNINDNTIINVPITLTEVKKDDAGNPQYLNLENIKTFLLNHEYFFVYFTTNFRGFSTTKGELYSTNDECYTEFDNLVGWCRLERYYLLPITDDKIDIDSLHNFFYKNELNYHYNYIIYFEETFLNINEDEVIRNLENIYRNHYEIED